MLHIRCDGRESRAAPAIARWREVVDDVFSGLQVQPQRESRGFQAAIDLLATPHLRLGTIRGSAHAVCRNAQSARRSDEIGLLLQGTGASRLDLDGISVDLAPGRAVLFDNARPYRFDLGESFEHHLLLIERSSIGFGAGRLSARCGEILPPTLPARLLIDALSRLCTELTTAPGAPVATLAEPLLAWLDVATERPVEKRPRGTDALFARIVADLGRRL
ncbi:MAG TPA: hypothetical protein VFF72_04860, partial [Caldimonas sp.]|nr:hypothetical protein [Caldimonas sp.]